ncbi:hypothetical protein Aperf_G00000054442 [Anoplocephala perfoliata]
MAQWFHRNPFKASGRPNFDLGPIATDIPARMYLSYLSERRKTLMRCFEDLTCSRSSVVEAANQYITLLLGLATSVDIGDAIVDEDSEGDESEKNDEEIPAPGANDATEKSKKDQKENKKLEKEAKKKAQKSKLPSIDQKKIHSLRRLIAFTWTDSLDVRHRSPITLRDANYELIGILFNLALCVEVEQAVDVYKSLRNAAGLFEHIKKVLLPQMNGKFEKGSDVDPIVLEAYVLQSLAEAQEVTIARAIELKHDPAIIAALASETAVLYEKCSK